MDALPARPTRAIIVLALVLGAALAVAAITASSASAYIYWANFNGPDGSIGRANLDGSRRDAVLHSRPRRRGPDRGGHLRRLHLLDQQWCSRHWVDRPGQARRDRRRPELHHRGHRAGRARHRRRAHLLDQPLPRAQCREPERLDRPGQPRRDQRRPGLHHRDRPPARDRRRRQVHLLGQPVEPRLDRPGQPEGDRHQPGLHHGARHPLRHRPARDPAVPVLDR